MNASFEATGVAAVPDLPSQDETLGITLRVRRLAAQVSGLLRRRLMMDRTIYIGQRSAELRAHWAEAAAILGADFVQITDRVWEVRLQGCTTRLCNHFVQADDPVVLELAGDKIYCAHLGEAIGTPMPEPWTALRLPQSSTARAFLRACAGPIVVKPSSEASGLGVTTSVCTPSQLRAAMTLASLYGPDIILQAMTPGETCRLLFIEGRLVDAVRRSGTRIVGDGRRSVAELLDPDLIDSMTGPTLAAQRLTRRSVPAPGRVVLVRACPTRERTRHGLRTIYDERITAVLHPEIVTQACRLVRAIGCDFAGVDLVTVDPSRSNGETRGAFLEVNTTPSIHHHYLQQGPSPSEPVAVTVLRSLLARPRKQSVIGVSAAV